MRLKSSDGPLQAVHNGNNDLLNSPKRVNTLQSTNYNQNSQTADTKRFINNDVINITSNIQQLTIEEVAALNNVCNDTQELQWCISELTSTGVRDQQQPTNKFQKQQQRHLALNTIANNRININGNLAARLQRLRQAQNARNISTYGDHPQAMPQSPDDVPIDEDGRQSCSSSTSASPQEEDRAFDPSDSAESSDEGSDYMSCTKMEVLPTKPKSFVNPNYPGFQHLAHTLDFDEETLNNANNNNEEYEIPDKFDSVNRLDSVENIQKVFHDKSLDFEVAQQTKAEARQSFPNASETEGESPNGSVSLNCDSPSECGGTSDSGTESGGTVNENFNIKLDEHSMFDGVAVKAIEQEKTDSESENNDKSDVSENEQSDIQENAKIVEDSGTKCDFIKNITVNNHAVIQVDDKAVNSVVGDFSQEIQEELKKVCSNELLSSVPPYLQEAKETELEEAVEQLQVIADQLALAASSIQSSPELPSTKEFTPIIASKPLVLEDIQMVKSPCKIVPDCQNLDDQFKINEDQFTETPKMATSIISMVADHYSRTNGTSMSKSMPDYNDSYQPMDIDQSKEEKSFINNVPKENYSLNSANPNEIVERRTVKKLPSFLPLNQKPIRPAPSDSKKVLSPIENKMADAMLSSCQDNISRTVAEKPLVILHIQPMLKKSCGANNLTKPMEVDCSKSIQEVNRKMDFNDVCKKVDLGRRDSNRELEEIEIQIKKIKSDTMCELEQMEKFRKEDITKELREKEVDSSIFRRNPSKLNTYVKKRRDYNQQFGSLITFPKKEPVRRDPLNRRSVPMVRERKKINSCEGLGGFDVYNIETAMPKIDLEAIECHLRAAREEEQRRRTDREEIRRRLAMGAEDDYYTDRPGRKPSLQARLQSGMNLQICFMNETVSDNESPSSDNECPLTNPKPPKTMKSNINQRNCLGNVPQAVQRPATLSLHPAPPPQLGNTQETDFFTKQARLQTEARMALAQAKEMARMQMEIEKQRQKKSPITEMVRHSLEKVGITFPEEKRRLSRQILTEMNVAQLQVIVNDLHTQIETLNEQLVKFLMDRDDLHMEQDSMLVDIEDLTRYLGAKEQVLKEQHISATPQNNNLPPPSPAPSSPLASLNSTVRPTLNRIASLVKK